MFVVQYFNVILQCLVVLILCAGKLQIVFTHVMLFIMTYSYSARLLVYRETRLIYSEYV